MLLVIIPPHFIFWYRKSIMAIRVPFKLWQHLVFGEYTNHSQASAGQTHRSKIGSNNLKYSRLLSKVF